MQQSCLTYSKILHILGKAQKGVRLVGKKIRNAIADFLSLGEKELVCSPWFEKRIFLMKHFFKATKDKSLGISVNVFVLSV